MIYWPLETNLDYATGVPKMSTSNVLTVAISRLETGVSVWIADH